MISQLNDSLKAVIKKHMKEYGYKANEIHATVTIDCADVLAGKPVTITGFTLNGHGYPVEQDCNFCTGEDSCDCGCGEFDGVDLDAESDAYKKAMGIGGLSATSITVDETIPDASEFMRQALSGELFGLAPKQRRYFFNPDPTSPNFDSYQGMWVDPSRLVVRHNPPVHDKDALDLLSAYNKMKNDDLARRMAARRIPDIYIIVNGGTKLAVASDYPAGTIVQSLARNWFKSDGSMWCVVTEQSTGPVEIKAEYSGPIAEDVDAIGESLKDIEPKYQTPKPPAEMLDVWDKGAARRNDGWLWRWSGTEWKKEGPAF